MPQSRSGGSRRSSSSSGSRSTGASSGQRSTRASGSRASTAKSSRSGSSSRASASGSRSRSTASRSRSTSGSGGARSTRTGGGDARLEAAAQRLRKLNERIIEAGKEAGESTLSSYEKALKTIASSLERGPGSSDMEWLSNLATAQAKFLRDVTSAWTTAARKVLK
jgi:hypothetical protein